MTIIVYYSNFNYLKLVLRIYRDFQITQKELEEKPRDAPSDSQGFTEVEGLDCNSTNRTRFNPVPLK